MTDEILITLLLHSVYNDTLINWKKTAAWLDGRAVNDSLTFLRKLLDKAASTTNNPILTQQTYELITNSSKCNSIIPKLSESHWHWLIKQASQSKQSAPISTWLNLLIEEHGVEQLNLSNLLALLPSNDTLIQDLLKNPIFKSPEHCARLFSQLSSIEDCSLQLVQFHQHLFEQDKKWLIQFFTVVNKQIDTTKLNHTAIHVLNSILLNNAKHFDPQQEDEKCVVSNYLKLLNQLTQQTTQSRQSAELKQIMHSFLTAYTCDNKSWAALLLSDPGFIETALNWLKNTDFTCLARQLVIHPLSTLVIENQVSHFAPKLKADPLFHQFVYTLLLNPTPNLKPEQFTALFEQLPHKTRVTVAKTLLNQPNLLNVHFAVINSLTNALPVDELCEHLDEYAHSSLIAQALFTHKNGFAQLSTTQITTLFKKINSGQQLISILTSQTDVQNRLNFVKELFKLYGVNAKTLGQKLAEWNITHESLAALANFIIEANHQRIFAEILKNKPYYLDFLHQYLAQPTLDMNLQAQSYLFGIASKNLLNPKAKVVSNAQFIRELAGDDAFNVLTTQYQSMQTSTESSADATTYFSQLLTTELQKERSDEHSELTSWILQTALTSPLSAQLDNSTLDRYLARIDPILLPSLLEASYGQFKLKLDHESLPARKAYLLTRLHQLVYFSLSYHPDHLNESRLINLSHKQLTQIPINIIMACLNSYKPLLAAKEFKPQQVIDILENYLTNVEIINSLDEDILKVIIPILINEPTKHYKLLEQILNSKVSEECLKLLQIELNSLIKQDQDPQPQSISQLKASFLEQIAEDKRQKILSLQRFIFFAKPHADLQAFAARADSSDTKLARQQFVADASLYQSLIYIEKQSGQRVEQSMAWVNLTSQTRVKSYAVTIDSFNIEHETKDPIALYYWLTWRSFIINNHKEQKNLCNELIFWLMKLTDKDLIDHKAFEHVPGIC